MAPVTNQQLEQTAYNLDVIAAHLGTDYATVSRCENLAWEAVWALQMKDDDIHSTRIEYLNNQVDELAGNSDANLEANHDQIVVLDNAITAETTRHAFYQNKMAASIPQRIRDIFHAGSYHH